MSTNTDKPSKDRWMNVRQSIGIVVIALLLFAYYVYTWRGTGNFRIAIDRCSQTFCDFADYYYPMGESILQTREPLTGFVYSPFIAFLFALFTPLGIDSALLLWGLLQGICILLFIGLFHRLIPTGWWIQLLFIFLALSSFPLLHNLVWGQVGIITTVSILGALFLYERGQRALAAVLLAFGISFKFFPLIFLLPFVIRRDLRFLLYSFIACAVFLIVIPAALLGMDGATRFYAALFDSYRHFDWVIANYNSQHFPHVILRLAKATGIDDAMLRLAISADFNPSMYLQILRWFSYSITALNAGLVYCIQRARLPHANLRSFHILFLTVPFVLLTSWPVDLVYISFAQGLLAWQLVEEQKVIRASRITSSILLLASIIISNIVFFNLLGNRNLYGSSGITFWSNALLLAASYVELLPIAFRQIRIATNSNILPSRSASVRTVNLNS
ncbi:MAG: DUF2029 domain-containing protein [Anaerolineales bacterium]|nr:DUF2029 domain-containing protein [Anaerolineales bacterium]